MCVEIDGQVKEPQYAQEEDFERQQPALMGMRRVDLTHSLLALGNHQEKRTTVSINGE